MKVKYFLIPASAIALALSPPAFAKKNKNDDHPGAYNSNNQSYEDSLQGLDRAEQRHELKRLKKKSKKNNKHKSDSGDSSDSGNDFRDDYSNERRDYPYHDAQRPIESGINQGAEQAKQKIDEIHRRTIEAIDRQRDELNPLKPMQ